MNFHAIIVRKLLHLGNRNKTYWEDSVLLTHVVRLEYIRNLVFVNFFAQNILCFLLGSSPASELYMPTFRNTLSVPSS